MDLTTSPPLSNGLQPLSCLRCAQHKVRCNRLNPCSRCNKLGTACEFPLPKTERRRRRNTAKTSARSSPGAPAATSTSALNDKLFARLDLYEEKLRSLGVDVEAINGSSAVHQSQPTTPISVSGGQLDVQSRRCPYAETTTAPLHRAAAAIPIDPAIDSAAAGCEHAVNNSSALTLGILPGTTAARIDNLYPPPQHFAKLWPIYLRNVHHITMILHPASTGSMLAEAARDPGHASDGAIVLLFAVMTAAVMSMTEEECVETCATKQSILRSRYRSGCELALARVEFLVSCNFAVLQAYTVYLSAVSADLDPRELWSLTGIAKRNAQRLGLHQEGGVKGLTLFDVEMRRRLWHRIAMHDAMSAQAMGWQWSDPHAIGKLEAPTNLNDSDLSPTMQEPVKPRVGATDMIFYNLRYKLIQFVDRVNGWYRQWLAPGEDDRDTATVIDPSCRADMQRIMESMEKEVELEILRYCDILDPLHLLTAGVARLTLCKQRFLMLKASSSQHGGGSSSLSNNQAEDDGESNMLSTAIRVLEYENNLICQPSIRGFLWYMQQEFLWSCLIYILQCLKARPGGEQADKAWDQIGRLYELRPSYYQGSKQKLALHVHAAIRIMTLEAWRAREMHYTSQCAQMLHTPVYITTLRDQEQCLVGGSRPSGHHHQAPTTSLETPPAPLPTTTTTFSSHTPRSQMESDLFFSSSNLGHDLFNWSDMPGLNPAASDTSGFDLFSSGAPVFGSETSTSTQGFDNDAGHFGFPSNWTRRHVL